MKYSSSFTHDLNFGESGEDWVNDIFAKGKKVEVKTDRMTPSGIATTDADYWVYKIDEVGFAIIFEVEILKAKLRKYYTDGVYLKKGGDNDTSKGFLVPIIQLFKK